MSLNKINSNFTALLLNLSYTNENGFISSSSAIFKFSTRVTMRKSRSQVSGQLGHSESEYGAARRGGGGRGGRNAKEQRGGQGVSYGSPATTVVSFAAESTRCESRLEFHQYWQRDRKLQNPATLSHDQHPGPHEYPATTNRHENERYQDILRSATAQRVYD